MTARLIHCVCLILSIALLFDAELPAADSNSKEPSSFAARVDQFIQEKAKGATFADRTSDAEFLRRVWLDLAGQIPPTSAVRAFLADAAPDKRRRVIDELLAAPSWPEHAAGLFHIHLMERRGEDVPWRDWLKQSFAENKPWDLMVREMLNPSADDEKTRGAAYFLTKRLENYGQNPVDYPGLVRDVGRLFLGKDLQCAECHNHLFIDDYKQQDFQGLFVVYRNTFLRRDVKFPALGEKQLAGKLEFVSVFDPTKRETGPRLPGGEEFTIPVVATPDATAKKKLPEPPRPQWSAVELLANEVTRPENRQFARNSVNRFWFVMMGRGLVHPLDLHHAGNPPSHPELLEFLTDEFIAHKFDVRWLIRELALTETWQRSSRLPTEVKKPSPASFTVALEKRLSSEELAASVLQATGPETLATPPEADRNELRTAFIEAFANDAREPEEDVASSVKGALFWRNDERVLKQLQKQPDNLIDRLSRQSDTDKLVDELFLAVLSRLPEPEERTDMKQFLAGESEPRELRLRDAAWALMTSIEFYVDH